MNKIFVGGLSWNTTSEELADYFSQVGDVTDSRVITDRETGKSRGFGFVTFALEEFAEAAVQALDGSELDGRRLRVNIAEDRRANRQNNIRQDNFNL